MKPTARDWSKALKLDAKLLEREQADLEAEQRKAAEPPPPPRNAYDHAARIAEGCRVRGGCLCGHFDHCDHGNENAALDAAIDAIRAVEAAQPVGEWLNDPPAPGIYWCWAGGGDVSPIEVVQGQSGLLVSRGSAGWFSLWQTPGWKWWSIPLAPPAGPL